MEEMVQRADENEHLPASKAQAVITEADVTEAGITAWPAYLHEEFYTMLREARKIRAELAPGKDLSYYLDKVERKNPVCGQWIRYVNDILTLEDSLDGKNVFSFISDSFEARKKGKFEGMDGPQSQKELCQQIRIKESTFTMRKINNKPFSRKEIRAIAAAIKLPPEYTECLYWVSGCPMDVDDPFYLQLMKAVYEELDFQDELKRRLPWLEPLIDTDAQAEKTEVKRSEKAGVKRSEKAGVEAKSPEPGKPEEGSSQIDNLEAKNSEKRNLKTEGSRMEKTEMTGSEEGTPNVDSSEKKDQKVWDLKEENSKAEDSKAEDAPVNHKYRQNRKEPAGFWELLSEIRLLKEKQTGKKLPETRILPEGISEVTWRRYKRAGKDPGLHDILRCCINLQANILQTSRLLSSAGYTLPDVERSRGATELMQQILDFNLRPTKPAQDDSIR